MIQPLDATTAVEYVRGFPQITQEVFGDESLNSLKAVQIAEGNINLIFRVMSERDARRSVLLKQALPYAWRYPDFKMPPERARLEYDVLMLEAKYCPDLVPRVYHFDAERNIMIIQDLNQHLIMREGMMQGIRYPRVARDIGTFMARTLFYTSDLYLSSSDKKVMVPRFINPILCKVQEDLVFTQPYMDHPNNRWTPQLTPLVEEIHQDDALRTEIFMLKERYMTHAQALIHNDLHTGSVMLNPEETKVIDPEFAFFGPIGHDVGTYMANMVIAYGAQEHHAPDTDARRSYRQWILDSMRETWQVFEQEFLSLWESEGNADWPSPGFRRRYMRQLLQDTAGFGAAEIMRRTIGMAHVHDFWTIKDNAVRAAAEEIALKAARRWLMERHTFESFEQLIAAIPAP